MIKLHKKFELKLLIEEKEIIIGTSSLILKLVAKGHQYGILAFVTKKIMLD